MQTSMNKEDWDKRGETSLEGSCIKMERKIQTAKEEKKMNGNS